MVVCMIDERDRIPIIITNDPRPLDKVAMPRVTGELATVQAGFTQLSIPKGS